jgi:hypothetical protein
MQEDEVQLVMALAQVSQRLSMAVHSPKPPEANQEGQDTLRIFLGRRLVYGRLADGTQRHELDANGLKVILEALQKPVTEGIEPEQYKNKVSAIEIRDGDTLLFREERDGTVTTNQIQLQIGEAEQQFTTESSALRALEAVTSLNGHNGSKPEAEKIPPSIDGERVAQIAARLINPLNESQPMYDAVAVGDYRIKQNGHHLAVRRDNSLILVVRDGEIISNQLTETDYAAFLQLETQLSPMTVREQPLEEPISGSVQNGHYPQELAVLEQVMTRLPEGQSQSFLQTTVKDWQHQPPEQQVSRLTTLLEHRRNQQLARTVLGLFQRGYERTGERVYQVGDYTFSQKETNFYSLRDKQGVLLQFQTLPGKGLSYKVEVSTVSDRLSEFDRLELKRMRQNRSFMPQGRLDSEATYAARTRQVEHTVREFLQHHVYANSWSKDGGQFKLEIGTDDLVRITDKWGRGVVFQRHHSEVKSRLTQKDLAYFDRLYKRMQVVRQQAQPKRQNQIEIG